MKLQGPKLSVKMQGDDVALLHRELQYLGLEIAESEIKGHFFGESTLDQVKRFQAEHGLAVTGEEDKQAAVLINALVARQAVTQITDTVLRGRKLDYHVTDFLRSGSSSE